MTESLYLSRARLRRDAPAAALRELLVPRNASARTVAGHHLVWTLFADAADRARDFLWREAEPGLFYLLSRRAPVDRHGLFEVDEPKPFEPCLAPGDRLAFALRANATVSRGGGKDKRGKPCDVVMDALYKVPPDERGRARPLAVEAAGRAWLVRQGEQAGFAVAPSGRELPPASGALLRPDENAECGADEPSVRVMGYRTLRVDRAGAPARLGVLDFEGVLEVRDPVRLVEAIARGFGRGKAFGCGLMLVRRA